LNHHIKEISEKYEAETKLLKGRISELELGEFPLNNSNHFKELAQQKQQNEVLRDESNKKAKEESLRYEAESLILQESSKTRIYII